MFDILIKNGRIIDGTARKEYRADIAVKDGSIAEIGLIDAKAKEVIDADNNIVCPGFIDPHSHADQTIMFYPKCESQVFQGVTTVIGGNCGGSPAPLDDYFDTSVLDLSVIKGVVPSYYTWYNSKLKKEDALAQISEHYGIDANYSTMYEFCEKIKQMTISINFYPLVGHGNIRQIVMKDDVNRAATEEEIAEMKKLLKDEIEHGIRGMSTGLDYPPGAYAATDEIVELAKTLKEYDSIYTSHVRGRKLFTTGEGGYDPIGGINEAVEIHKKTGVQIHISHINGMDTPDNMKKMLDDLRGDGVNITMDAISNITGGGGTFSHLAFILKPWYLTAGSKENFLRNLNDPDYVEAMKKDMASSKWYFANSQALPGVEGAILIIGCKAKEYIGKTVLQIMEERNWKYDETLINIIKSDVMTKIKYGAQPNEAEHKNMKALFEHKYIMPSSDAQSFDDKARLLFEEPLNFLPHQNSYMYMIKYLTKYVGGSLEESIRKATGLVAETFGILDRGTIEVGKAADIVIYDENKLDCNEDISDPRRYPKGIDKVIINGKVTVNNGAHTGERAGKIL